MAEITTMKAAGALADFFGPHLEAGRDEGRKLMADALHTQFGISTHDARQLIDVLEHAGSIRWVTRHVGAAPVDLSHGRAPEIGMLEGEGYWQLESA